MIPEQLSRAPEAVATESEFAQTVDGAQWEAETIGVLNLYAPSADAFDSHDIRIAGLFGAAPAAVVEDVRERDGLRQLGRQLEEALASRAEIDQAKGIIMARHGCSADEAFTRPVTVSRNTDTKLSDLSSRLVRGAVRQRTTSR